MKETTKRILDELIERYPALTEQQENVRRAFGIAAEAYGNGKKLLVCGNGGSASHS